jgi:hypothetical protein
VAKAEENLFTYSQEFENAYWVKGRVTVTANSTTAPDGTTTADTLVEDSTNQTHVLAPLVSASGIVTLSVFAKPATGSRFLTIQVNRDGSNFASATFDLSAGTSTQTQVAGAYSGVTASITASTNGFYRCIMTVTTDTVSEVRFALNNTGTPTSSNRGTGSPYTGDGTSSLYIWGAQIEARSSVTAYTATTTAPITNYIPALQTAASGVARFEHNPVTGESLGLEIEEQRTNLLVRSEEMDNVAWAKTTISVQPNVIISPDGTLSGDKLVVDNAGSLGNVSESPAYTYGVANTCSAFVKAGEWTWVSLEIRGTDAVARRTWYNLSTGVVGASDGGSTGTITPVGNGWYRCTITATLPSGGSSSRFRIIPTNADYAFTTGNGLSGIYAWGAQAEVGSFATSYIPTVASQVTRSADSASMTGTNFSSWYRADAHTAYSEYTVLKAPDATVNSNAVFGYGNGTGDEYVHLDTNNGATQIRGLVRAKATTYSASQGTVTAGTTIKAAIALSAGNGAFSANGATATAVNPVVMPLPTFANIGKNTAFSVFLNGNIKKIAFYPARLTNAELQGLTTV